MHNAALRATGLDGWEYLALPLPPPLFTETVRALPAVGFRGVNVTIPHKEAALALADSASPAARAIGAANTLTFEPDGAILADHTASGGPGTPTTFELDLSGEPADFVTLEVGPLVRPAGPATLPADGCEIAVDSLALLPAGP